MNQTNTQLFLESLRRGEALLPIPEMIEFASKNKMLLYFLREMEIRGSLRDQNEKAFSNIISTVESLQSELDGLDYAYFKFIEPVPYLPRDIDLLTTEEEICLIARRLERNGYRRTVDEPHCISLRGPITVDLYIHPSFANLIYLDGRELLKETVVTNMEGLRLRVLRPEVEALVAAAHAFYKEQIFTLKDYTLMKKYVNDRTYDVARRLNTIGITQLAKTIMYRVEEGLLETPYRVPPNMIIPLYLRKLMRDSMLRTSIIDFLGKLKDRRIGTQMSSWFRRVSY
jgi:hypothetical protein